MADPFSIAVGAAGLADISLRFLGFLKQAKAGFQKTDTDLEELLKDVTALHSASDLIKLGFETESLVIKDPSDQHIIENHWKATAAILKASQEILERLGELIANVLGKEKPSYDKLHNLRKYLRLQLKESEFTELRQRLHAHLSALQTSLAAVNIIYSRESHSKLNDSFSNISKRIQDQGSDLRSQIAALQANIRPSSEKVLNDAVISAQDVVPLASLNKHFCIPQTVSSIYTGRSNEINTLSDCLQPSTSINELQAQRRFVVYGLPGSGKTQFCCKFASDNRHSFWGVFWIDASTSDNAKQSFATIARIGMVDQNEGAAKNWLSSLGTERPWLLIIDNTEELDSSVDELFPESHSGVILLTTRNPILKMYGTAGPRYYHFAELGEMEAVELLLRAADEPLPWSQSTIDTAKVICRTLGYLPLALLHAGKTILSRLCTLSTYLDFFEKNWNRIRRMKSSRNKRTITDANAAIYSSYEIIHGALMERGVQATEDALDLLRIFSFFHRQRIRVDIISRAALNPSMEMQRQQELVREEKVAGVHVKPNATWTQSFKTLRLEVLGYLLNLGYRPVLPRILADALQSGYYDELRLREALKELYQFSLIFANPDAKDDSYSMHPAVHLWVRERPEMTLGDQAIWCQIAATILSQAILLPPLGDTEYDEILRRDLLPHVNHVQVMENIIRDRFLENQRARHRVWPVLTPPINRALAMQIVKFSLIYYQCGQLEEAEKLQLQVKDFCMRSLGIEHTSTMDIMLLLSRTYQLTKGDEAARIQQRVLDTCIKARGKDALKTLRVMDIVGSSRWQQGRVREARELHQTAVNGLKKLLGDNHVDTLRATGNLGRAIGKDFEFSEAIKLHTKVVSGLREKLGNSHLDTLMAVDNLAMAHYDRAAFGYGQAEDLDIAIKLEQEVWEDRRRKVGKENLFTLWSGLNLARIKALRGEIDEALAIFLPGHEIARRNLGETHFGVLLGKMHHGRFLTYAKRYEEAEGILLEVVDSYDQTRKAHPDRVIALISLIKCRNLLGKQAETTALAQELMEKTKAIFGEDHPWVRYALKVTNGTEHLEQQPTTAVESIADVNSGNSSPQELPPMARIARYGHI